MCVGATSLTARGVAKVRRGAWEVGVRTRGGCNMGNRHRGSSAWERERAHRCIGGCTSVSQRSSRRSRGSGCGDRCTSDSGCLGGRPAPEHTQGSKQRSGGSKRGSIEEIRRGSRCSRSRQMRRRCSRRGSSSRGRRVSGRHSSGGWRGCQGREDCRMHKCCRHSSSQACCNRGARIIRSSRAYNSSILHRVCHLSLAGL